MEDENEIYIKYRSVVQGNVLVISSGYWRTYSISVYTKGQQTRKSIWHHSVWILNSEECRRASKVIPYDQDLMLDLQAVCDEGAHISSLSVE